MPEITYNNTPSSFPTPNATPAQDPNLSQPPRKNSPAIIIGLIAFILILALSWIYLIFGRGTGGAKLTAEEIEQSLPAVPGTTQ